jgi:alpha-beta hydrolase superfamily lysophospholipase
MRWIPEGEVKAVLQIVHGMSEHIERYRSFANYMADRGILVVGHDHLGHGESIESEKDLGYFADENGNAHLIGDIQKVVRLTKRNYKKIPYILLGHSMGSFLARQYLCVHGTELDGAIICGTGYHPKAVAKLGMRVASSEARMHDWHYRSKLLHWMSFGSYNAKFRPARTDSDWLCSDEKIVDAYISDPKCGFPFTVNGYYNMFLGISKIMSSSCLERMPKSLPVILIAGEQDPVGDSGKGVRKVESLFRKYGMQNVVCRLYPDSRHELLNEHGREQVYADLIQWMEQNQILCA